MKQRIISAVAGLCVLLAVLLLYDTMVLNITISAIIAIAIYELLKACGAFAAPVAIPAILFGAAIPFIDTDMTKKLLPAACLLFVIILLCYLLKAHKEFSAEKIGFVFFFTTAVSFSTSCFVYSRDNFGVTIGLYVALLTLAGAWLNDTGGYFGGMLFGKHKLAPLISPKKTVEGFICGIIVSILSQLLFTRIFVAAADAACGITVQADYLRIALAGPFIALLSVLGDLSASAVKRQYGIKDFGNIMPGHGGVMDRFDSVLLTLPLIYIIMVYYPLITIK